MTGGAFAADLPSRGPAPAFVPPPIFTWTGIYVGVQAGYQWSSNSSGLVYSPTGAAVTGQPNYNQSGVIGGGHVGYNYQINQFVLGIEGDIEGSTLQGSGPYASGAYTFQTNVDLQGSVRGRLGVTWERALFYTTGGVAFSQVEDQYTKATTGALDDLKTSRTGWTIGGGVEYAFRPNWSASIEYRYTDLGRYTDILANSSAGTFGVNRHETQNSVRFGVSYHFNTSAPLAPILAKY